MSKLRLFYLGLLILLILTTIISSQTVKGQPTSWFIIISPKHPYYLRGETSTFFVMGNASMIYTFTIYNPQHEIVYQQNRQTDPNGRDVVNLKVLTTFLSGTYTIKANLENTVSTTWVSIVETTNYQPQIFPYTKQHKGVNYTIKAKGFQAVSESGNITIKYPSLPISFSVNAYANNMSFVERLKNTQLGIKIDLCYLFIHKGMKLVINGSIPQPTSYTFNFENPRELVKKLDALKDGFLVFDWSDMRKATQAFSYNHETKRLTVNIPQTFKIDPYVFEDGFESGFTTWTGTSGSPTINQTVVHHGTNSCKIDGMPEYVYKDLESDYTTAYMRAYVRFESLSLTTDQSVLFMRLGESTSGDRTVGAEIYHNGTDYYLTLHNDYYGSHTTTFKPNLNQWYCIEIKFQQGTGSANGLYMWIDGNEEAGPTTNGIPSSYANRTTVGYSGSSTNVYFVDCVVVDTSYIGVEASNNAPTIGEFACDSTVYANKYSFVNATIDDADGVADFENCTVQLNSTIQLKWLNSTNTFSELADSSNYCTLDTSNSVKTSVNSTAVKLSWKIKLYWNYTEGSIFINGTVWDDEPTNGTASTTSLFTFEDDLTVSSVSHTPFEPEIGHTFTITGYLYYLGTTTAVEDSTGVTVYLMKHGWQIDSTTSIMSGQWSFSHSEAESNVYYYDVYAMTDETTNQVTEEVNVVKGAGTPITPTPLEPTEPTEPVTPIEPTPPITPTPRPPQPIFQLPFSPLYIMVGLIVVAVSITAYQVQSKPTLKSAKKQLKKKGLHPNAKFNKTKPKNAEFKKVKINKKLNSVLGNTKKKKKKTKWKKKEPWT